MCVIPVRSVCVYVGGAGFEAPLALPFHYICMYDSIMCWNYLMIGAKDHLDNCTTCTKIDPKNKPVNNYCVV